MNDYLDLMRLIGSILLLSALPALLLFAIYYYFRSPFTATPEGINRMGEKIAFSLVILLGLATLALPENPVLYGLRLVVYGATAFFLWVDFKQLRAIQKQYPYRRPRKVRTRR